LLVGIIVAILAFAGGAAVSALYLVPDREKVRIRQVDGEQTQQTIEQLNRLVDRNTR
jgi:hypothetical protein